MTIKEQVITEIGTMQESNIENLMPFIELAKLGISIHDSRFNDFIELLKKGVNIHDVRYGRPVVKESELSKLDLKSFFNDGFEAKE